MNGTAPQGGASWLGSLRRAVDSLRALARGRFELFAVEFELEKLRLIRWLTWLGLAVVLAGAGLLSALAALALWLWATAGYAGLIGLALAALALAGVIFLALCHSIKTSPPPFAATVEEFRKDEECLSSD